MASFFGPDANEQAKRFVADMRARGENPVKYGFTGTQQEKDAWAQGQARRSGASSQQNSPPQATATAPKVGGAPDMSAWGNQSGGGFRAWQAPSTSTTNPGFISQFGQQPTTDMSNFGNMANQPRPQVDQSQQWAQQMAQMQSSMNQRAAALAQVLDQGGIYKTAGALNQDIGRPQYDPQAIMQNANSMVMAGWQNPLQNIAAPPPGPAADPVSNLFASYGMTAPPGFMDQLLGLLGQQATPQQLGPTMERPTMSPQPPSFDPFSLPTSWLQGGAPQATGGGYEAPQMVGGRDPYPTTQLRDNGMQYERWAMRNPDDPRAAPILDGMRQREAARRERLAQQGTPVGPDGLIDSERQRQSEFRERMEAKKPDSVATQSPTAPTPPPVWIGPTPRTGVTANNFLPVADEDRGDRSVPPRPPGRYNRAEPIRYGDVVDNSLTQENAIRFLRELEKANPATWSGQQWSDYERARSDVSRADVDAYYRDQDGQIQRSRHRADPTLGNADFTLWRDSKNIPAGAVYNRAENERLFDQYMSETGGRRLSDLPPQPPSPGTATPVLPTPTGNTYPSTTPSLPPAPANTPRPAPLPPSRPPVSPEDQAKAKREAELRTARQLQDDVRRSRATAWAANNPNNWFMNPYMQDDPKVQAVRKRNPAVNKSGKGGGGSSPSKQINFKGPPTTKRG